MSIQGLDRAAMKFLTRKILYLLSSKYIYNSDSFLTLHPIHYFIFLNSKTNSWVKRLYRKYHWLYKTHNPIEPTSREKFQPKIHKHIHVRVNNPPKSPLTVSHFH